MSLLQSPVKALDQIEWYLQNQRLEHFPGAFLIAAGNLSRQVLEQVVFILAFYSRMPRSQYLRSNGQLRNAGHILSALRKRNPSTGRTYYQEARRRGTRIRKFARWPRSLDKWRDRLNVPSHFQNPAGNRKTRENDIRDFLLRMRSLLDDRDPHLITAAVNEIRSKGKWQATLSEDRDNIPGIVTDIIVGPEHLRYENETWVLSSPKFPIRIVPDDEEVPHRWPNTPVVVQHSTGMSIGGRFITQSGEPVDVTSLSLALRSFAKTSEGRRRLEQRLRRFGFTLQPNSRQCK